MFLTAPSRGVGEAKGQCRGERVGIETKGTTAEYKHMLLAFDARAISN